LQDTLSKAEGVPTNVHKKADNKDLLIFPETFTTHTHTCAEKSSDNVWCQQYSHNIMVVPQQQQLKQQRSETDPSRVWHTCESGCMHKVDAGA
jgi:hypothetical protein